MFASRGLRLCARWSARHAFISNGGGGAIAGPCCGMGAQAANAAPNAAVAPNPALLIAILNLLKKLKTPDGARTLPLNANSVKLFYVNINVPALTF